MFCCFLFCLTLFSIAPQDDPQLLQFFQFRKSFETETSHTRFNINDINGMHFSDFLVYLAHKGHIPPPSVVKEGRLFYKRLFWGLINHQKKELNDSLLTEIVDNAIDATSHFPDSSIDISIDYIHKKICVQNTSEGFSFQKIDRFFLPYLSSKQLNQHIGRFGQGLKLAFSLLRSDTDFLTLHFFDTDSSQKISIQFYVQPRTTVSPHHPEYLDNIMIQVIQSPLTDNDNKKTLIEIQSEQLTKETLDTLQESCLSDRYAYYSNQVFPTPITLHTLSELSETYSIGQTNNQLILKDPHSMPPSWFLESLPEFSNTHYLVFSIAGRAIFKVPCDQSLVLHLPPSLIIDSTKNTILPNDDFFDIMFSFFDTLCSQAQHDLLSFSPLLQSLLLSFRSLNDTQYFTLKTSLQTYLTLKFPQLFNHLPSITSQPLKLQQPPFHPSSSLSTTLKTILTELSKKSLFKRPSKETASFFEKNFKRTLNDFFDFDYPLSKEDLEQSIHHPLFSQFCSEITFAYQKILEDNKDPLSDSPDQSNDRGNRSRSVKSIAYRQYLLIAIKKVIHSIPQHSSYRLLPYTHPFKSFFTSFIQIFQDKQLKFEDKIEKSKEEDDNEKTLLHSVPLEDIELPSHFPWYHDRIRYKETSSLSSFLPPPVTPSLSQKYEELAQLPLHQPLKNLPELQHYYGNTEVVVNKLKSLQSLNLHFINGLLEVVSNSMEAQSQNITIQSGLFQDQPLIIVEDDGVGIDEPLSVLIPFKSTKSLEEGTNFGWGLYQTLTVFDEIVLISQTKTHLLHVYLKRNLEGEIFYHYDKKLQPHEHTGTKVYLFNNHQDSRINPPQLQQAFLSAIPIPPSHINIQWKDHPHLFGSDKKIQTFSHPPPFHINIFSDIPLIFQSRQYILNHFKKHSILHQGYLNPSLTVNEIVNEIETCIGILPPSIQTIVSMRLKKVLELKLSITATSLKKGTIRRNGIVSEHFSNKFEKQLSYQYEAPSLFSSSPPPLHPLPRSLLVDFPTSSKKNLEGSDIYDNFDPLIDFDTEKISTFFIIMENTLSYTDSLDDDPELQPLVDSILPYMWDDQFHCILPEIFSEGWLFLTQWSCLPPQKQATLKQMIQRQKRLQSSDTSSLPPSSPPLTSPSVDPVPNWVQKIQDYFPLLKTPDSQFHTRIFHINHAHSFSPFLKKNQPLLFFSFLLKNITFPPPSFLAHTQNSSLASSHSLSKRNKFLLFYHSHLSSLSLLESA